ncbi:4a-hydroxytetrahydrobiopterin dehydratase [Aquimarina brevivitae]|uniref:Putative pterin-4-alpha-carbinolamine dehydratase n=1 Tax=Aquimarina brevivitae TaxID=323412 RepID=A0A4Q7NU54_9FLAO|nr:4a-hydroxytetrahydrobiopterin dehydratase [Aquimarina brevivitae]RZS90723.1 4a-hydroxytetrahydrobiopterin dehydratase [Aquimarina brevivitae]
MKKLSEDEIQNKLKDHSGWHYENNAIHTSFEFNDFKDAFSVMSRIAFEAEAAQHHPDWTNVYNKLHITLSTHDADGVTEKDLALAAIIDNIIEGD